MVLPKDTEVMNHSAISPHQFAQDLRTILLKLEPLARENLGAARMTQEAFHNRRVKRHRGFKLGDRVWRVNRASNKKECPRIGPYTVVETLAHDVFKIRDPSKNSNQLIAVNGRNLVAVRERKSSSSSSEDEPLSGSDTDPAVDGNL